MPQGDWKKAVVDLEDDDSSLASALPKELTLWATRIWSMGDRLSLGGGDGSGFLESGESLFRMAAMITKIQATPNKAR